MVWVQENVRTCQDCGLCCTEAHNAAEILPVEAERVAEHLRGLPPGERRGLVARLEATVKHYQLPKRGELVRYTCSFLQKDMTCALPLSVKPTVCLSFNPLTEDACDQESEWFHRVHDECEADNTLRGFASERLPIPVAVLRALSSSEPLRTERPPRPSGPNSGKRRPPSRRFRP